MPAPLGLQAAVLRHILRHRVSGARRFPLVLMLEPLFACNLACRGCGKVRYPPDVMRMRMTPRDCWAAAEECPTPVVAVAGGEPLIHPEITDIVSGLIERGRYVHLCTNALLLEKSLPRFRASPRLIWSVHLDGAEAAHDKVVGRPGAYRAVVKAMAAAKAEGHRLMTNTTVFVGENPDAFRRFLDDCMALGVDGMIISPGYAYDLAPDRGLFLGRAQAHAWFREALDGRRSAGWDFNHSPYYLDFLEGRRDYECMPWGNPLRHVLGWQRPCYLMADGEPARSFRDLMETTPWERYGRRSGHPNCAQCLAHVGYEPAAVLEGFSSLPKFLRMALDFMAVKRGGRSRAARKAPASAGARGS